MKHIDIYMNAILQQSGLDLTKNQILVLRLINAGMKNQSDLSVITERNKSSLSRIIKSLEKKGFVEKATHKDDKRQQLVELTNEGEKKLDQAVPIMEYTFQKIEKGIDLKELELARNVIAQLLENVESELERLN